MRTAKRYAFQLSSTALLRRPAPAKGAYRGCPPQCAEPLQGRGEGNRFRDAAESRRRNEADFSCAEVDRGIDAGEPFELDTRLHEKDGIYRGFPARYNLLVEEGRATRWYLSATENESRKQEGERVRQENVRLEERTRIAQELHDTLLQTFQSASLHLGAVVLRVAQDSPVKNQLDRILEIMRQGIVEGRGAIQGLRSTDSQSSDLVGALSGIQDELKVQPDIDFCVTVTGRQKKLAREIQHEIYRIGREALVNAFCHSGAKRIELELEYSDSELHVRIRDNGRGIDPQVLEQGRDGHWGLAGMRERATRIGGLLKLSSSPAAGTEVQLSIPTSFIEGIEGLNWNQNELQNRSSR
jgi:signal transduction histidine kinase